MARVVTAVISDLHLGTRSNIDLLRRPEIRRRLLSELEDVDQLVLLGDSLELRGGPPAKTLAAAAPFFEEVGAALSGGRVTVVAGNHDHGLAEPWLERRRGAGPLGLEQVVAPVRGDPLAAFAPRMGGAELVLAYPGVWLRHDIYATHGHYLDCHNRVPTFECLARAVSERLTRAPPDGYRAPDDYEAVLQPVYRFIDRVGRSAAVARFGRAAVAAAEQFARPGGGPKRRRGLRAMAQVVERLGIEAGYVVFGHLHRPGPLDGDGPGWTAGTGTRLVNTGGWVYERAYLGAMAADSPAWPGTCVLVRDEGPPELRHLLRGLGHDDFRIPER
jgi:Calcineurin-like phosphoesterase